MSLAAGAENRSYLVKWFRTDDQYLFDPDSISETMDALEEPIRSQGLIPVWSEEILLGNPMTRHYDGAWTLSKLQRVNRKFKIIITVRKQNDLCISAYKEYLKFGRHSLRDFIGSGSEPRSFHPILSSDYLRYDVAAKKYADVFGSENVLILPQELLRLRPTDFMNRLTMFSGLPSAPAPPLQELNVGMGGTAVLSARIFNAFFLRSPLSQEQSFFEKVSRKIQKIINYVSPQRMDLFIERRWKEKIKIRYASTFNESNTRLQALTDVDLSELGYITNDNG